jgi:hypothetical protein
VHQNIVRLRFAEMQAFLFCFHSRSIPALVILSTSYKDNFLTS